MLLKHSVLHPMTTGPGHTAWPAGGLHQLPEPLAWPLCAGTSGLGKQLLRCRAAAAIHLHQAMSLLVEPVTSLVSTPNQCGWSQCCKSKQRRHGQLQKLSLMSHVRHSFHTGSANVAYALCCTDARTCGWLSVQCLTRTLVTRIYQ